MYGTVVSKLLHERGGADTISPVLTGAGVRDLESRTDE